MGTEDRLTQFFSDMFHSISKLHLTGKITDEEKAELKDWLIIQSDWSSQLDEYDKLGRSVLERILLDQLLLLKEIQLTPKFNCLPTPQLTKSRRKNSKSLSCQNPQTFTEVQVRPRSFTFGQIH